MTVKHIFNFSIFKDHLLSNSGSVDYKVFVLLVILQGTYVIQILLFLCHVILVPVSLILFIHI